MEIHGAAVERWSEHADRIQRESVSENNKTKGGKRQLSIAFSFQVHVTFNPLVRSFAVSRVKHHDVAPL